MTPPNPYHDYRFRASADNFAKSLGILGVLRESGLLHGSGPVNMLGDPYSGDGKPASDETAVFRARWDKGYYYFHVRTKVDLVASKIDPAAYGLEPVDEKTSANILGVWA